jgi:hypothetical protein
MPSSTNQTWLSPVAHFAGHSLVGTLVFIIIALPALGLGFLVSWLRLQGISEYVLGVLTLLEYAIVTLDAAALFLHLVYSAYKAFKEDIK